MAGVAVGGEAGIWGRGSLAGEGGRGPGGKVGGDGGVWRMRERQSEWK